MNLNKNLLSVKWDEFDGFVVKGLSNLYQRDELADATLFCDGRSFKAHRVILSVWSSYFKEVFATTSHPHPVIILRETRSSDLELLLRFIYQGQLFVPFEDADRFLKTAEYFQIAGLRDMKVIHSSSTSTAEGDSSMFFQSSSNSTGHNSSKSLNTSSSTFQSTTASSFSGGNSVVPIPTPTANNNNNSPGIPIQIISDSNSPSSSASSSQQHYHQHSNISPISIITENTSQQSQFSTNVIKHNCRQQRQHPQQHMQHPRPISPPVHLNQSYQTRVPTNNVKQPHPQENPLYHTQPVLILHNQPTRSNEYHGNKHLLESTTRTANEQQVVLLERVGPGNQMVQSINQSHINLNEGSISGANNGGNSFAVYSHSQSSSMISDGHPGQEEVLGLAYLHSEDNHRNNSSSHSQIIQEAAAAAGVAQEDAEIVEITRESSLNTNDTTVTDVVVNSNRSTFKPNSNSTIMTSTTTPIYAVKRVPPPSYPQTSEPNQQTSSSTPSTSKSSFPNNNINKRSKSKKKSFHDTQKTGDKKVELVSCPKCKKRVKQTSLKVHIKRTHLEEGTVLVCPICDKQISSKGVYYKHMYVHRQKSDITDNHNETTSPTATNRKSDKNQQSSNIKSESLT